MQNVIHMNVLRGGKRLDFALRASRRDRRISPFETDELFKHKLRTRAAARSSKASSTSSCCANHPLAFAIVAAGRRLQHARQSQVATAASRSSSTACDLTIRRDLTPAASIARFSRSRCCVVYSSCTALRNIGFTSSSIAATSASTFSNSYVMTSDMPSQFARSFGIVISRHNLTDRDLTARRIRRRIQRNEPVAHCRPACAIIRPSCPPPKNADGCLPGNRTCSDSHCYIRIGFPYYS